MPSARISRPSASVLITSIVLPFIALTMSPGLVALPPGMFSVAGTMPTTLIFGLILPIAHIAAMTPAPPDMSYFMSSMRSAGLIEMPPRVERDALADEREQLSARRDRRCSAAR